jgi:hypothetical protein
MREALRGVAVSDRRQHVIVYRTEADIQPKVNPAGWKWARAIHQDRP